MITCPLNCTAIENGVCLNTGDCYCEENFSGSGCEIFTEPEVVEKKCPNDCTGNGECNKITGLCTC